MVEESPDKISDVVGFAENDINLTSLNEIDVAFLGRKELKKLAELCLIDIPQGVSSQELREVLAYEFGQHQMCFVMRPPVAPSAWANPRWPRLDALFTNPTEVAHSIELVDDIELSRGRKETKLIRCFRSIKGQDPKDPNSIIWLHAGDILLELDGRGLARVDTPEGFEIQIKQRLIWLNAQQSVVISFASAPGNLQNPTATSLPYIWTQRLLDIGGFGTTSTPGYTDDSPLRSKAQAAHVQNSSEIHKSSLQQEAAPSTTETSSQEFSTRDSRPQEQRQPPQQKSFERKYQQNTDAGNTSSLPAPILDVSATDAFPRREAIFIDEEYVLSGDESPQQQQQTDSNSLENNVSLSRAAQDSLLTPPIPVRDAYPRREGIMIYEDSSRCSDDDESALPAAWTDLPQLSFIEEPAESYNQQDTKERSIEIEGLSQEQVHSLTLKTKEEDASAPLLPSTKNNATPPSKLWSFDEMLYDLSATRNSTQSSPDTAVSARWTMAPSKSFESLPSIGVENGQEESTSATMIAFDEDIPVECGQSETPAPQFFSASSNHIMNSSKATEAVAHRLNDSPSEATTSAIALTSDPKPTEDEAITASKSSSNVTGTAAFSLNEKLESESAQSQFLSDSELNSSAQLVCQQVLKSASPNDSISGLKCTISADQSPLSPSQSIESMSHDEALDENDSHFQQQSSDLPALDSTVGKSEYTDRESVDEVNVQDKPTLEACTSIGIDEYEMQSRLVQQTSSEDESVLMSLPTQEIETSAKQSLAAESVCIQKRCMVLSALPPPQIVEEDTSLLLPSDGSDTGVSAQARTEPGATPPKPLEVEDTPPQKGALPIDEANSLAKVAICIAEEDKKSECPTFDIKENVFSTTAVPSDEIASAPKVTLPSFVTSRVFTPLSENIVSCGSEENSFESTTKKPSFPHQHLTNQCQPVENKEASCSLSDEKKGIVKEVFVANEFAMAGRLSVPEIKEETLLTTTSQSDSIESITKPHLDDSMSPYRLNLLLESLESVILTTTGHSDDLLSIAQPKRYSRAAGDVFLPTQLEPVEISLLTSDTAMNEAESIVRPLDVTGAALWLTRLPPPELQEALPKTCEVSPHLIEHTFKPQRSVDAAILLSLPLEIREVLLVETEAFLDEIEPLDFARAPAICTATASVPDISEASLFTSSRAISDQLEPMTKSPKSSKGTTTLIPTPSEMKEIVLLETRVLSDQSESSNKPLDISNERKCLKFTDVLQLPQLEEAQISATDVAVSDQIEPMVKPSLLLRNSTVFMSPPPEIAVIVLMTSESISDQIESMAKPLHFSSAIWLNSLPPSELQEAVLFTTGTFPDQIEPIMKTPQLLSRDSDIIVSVPLEIREILFLTTETPLDEIEPMSKSSTPSIGLSTAILATPELMELELVSTGAFSDQVAPVVKPQEYTAIPLSVPHKLKEASLSTTEVLSDEIGPLTKPIQVSKDFSASTRIAPPSEIKEIPPMMYDVFSDENSFSVKPKRTSVTCLPAMPAPINESIFSTTEAISGEIASIAKLIDMSRNSTPTDVLPPFEIEEFFAEARSDQIDLMRKPACIDTSALSSSLRQMKEAALTTREETAADVTTGITKPHKVLIENKFFNESSSFEMMEPLLTTVTAISDQMTVSIESLEGFGIYSAEPPSELSHSMLKIDKVSTDALQPLKKLSMESFDSLLVSFCAVKECFELENQRMGLGDDDETGPIAKPPPKLSEETVAKNTYSQNSKEEEVLLPTPAVLHYVKQDDDTSTPPTTPTSRFPGTLKIPAPSPMSDKFEDVQFNKTNSSGGVRSSLGFSLSLAHDTVKDYYFVVVRSVRPGSTLDGTGVGPGCTLDSVNGETLDIDAKIKARPTERPPDVFEHTLDAIRKKPRPMRLSFRLDEKRARDVVSAASSPRGSSPKSISAEKRKRSKDSGSPINRIRPSSSKHVVHEYDRVFHGATIGMTLALAVTRSGVPPVVEVIGIDANCEHQAEIELYDILVAIDRKHVVAHTPAEFQTQVLDVIAGGSRPITLTFQQPRYPAHKAAERIRPWQQQRQGSSHDALPPPSLVGY